MFNKIIETLVQDSAIYHTLSNGTLISGFEVDLLDEELNSPEHIEGVLQSLLKDLPQGQTLKIFLKSTYSNKTENNSRIDAIEAFGYLNLKAYVLLEKHPHINLKFLFKTTKAIELNEAFSTSFITECGLKAKPLNQDQVESFLPKVEKEIFHSFHTIDLGTQLASILRLNKQSEFGMDFLTFSRAKEQIPSSYIICCSVESVSQSIAESTLRRRSKQNSLTLDINENRKFEEAQSDLEDISLNGSKLYRFEWQCMLLDVSDHYLRTNRSLVKRALSPLGEIYLESVGALESFKSFYPGERIHCPLLEKDTCLVTYLPLITRGDSQSRQLVEQKSLPLHRKDESLTYLNVFDKSYESFSWCIFGRPGTGKSVLTNAITRALNFDPSIKIIKIDVGGSHSKETEILNGVERTLSLNEPTGINPFNVLKELGPTKEAIQILASFIEVLILEENEVKLSKTMKSHLERALTAYADINQSNPNLENFYHLSPNLPRRELLQRWVGDGVYGNAFAVTEEQDNSWTDSNLIYFNFSKISQALDPDYAQGGLAAVMAQFNLEMLKKDENKKKIVFIADETPFFIKKCFSFFNLSIANVRKEGHGFITIAQKSAHVVIDGDTGILDNSPNKIFFSVDGDDESFMARNQLDQDVINKIKALSGVPGEISECVLKDIHGTRLLRIRLSPEEYWAYTSRDEDKRKTLELMRACPSLKLVEILKCLSLL